MSTLTCTGTGIRCCMIFGWTGGRKDTQDTQNKYSLHHIALLCFPPSSNYSSKRHIALARPGYKLPKKLTWS